MKIKGSVRAERKERKDLRIVMRHDSLLTFFQPIRDFEELIAKKLQNFSLRKDIIYKILRIFIVKKFVLLINLKISLKL